MKKHLTDYRINGAIGALLDEYEKAIRELKEVISGLSEAQLTQIVDPDTQDPDCRSVQTILSHVVASGHNYVIAIRKSMGESLEYREKEKLSSVEAYKIALDRLLDFNVQFFTDYPAIALEEFDTDKKVHVRWGQVYDVEQLYEHAIVHILRHRRQIEIFKIRMGGG